MPLPHLPLDAERLEASFYERDTAEVARELIGKLLLHRVGPEWLGGRIVETEAYLHRRDPASHSARGQTPRNASMFGPPGTLYVYSIHAKYCLNAVTQPTGEGAAVLIRALQPLWGVETMKRLRNQQELRRLTAGPAMLCQALRIERRDDGRCLTTDPEIGIFETQEALPAGRTSVGQANAGQTPPRVVATKRIGISKAAHRNLRFIDPASAFLSRPHRAK